MSRTLDLSAVWNDTLASLRTHREGIIAVAGMLMLVPSWASGFFVPPPDIEGLTSISDIFAAQNERFEQYWTLIIPLGIMSFFGSVAVLTLLLRTDMERIGDALFFALKLLPIYFLASLLAGLLTGFGALALLIGAFYVAARLMPVGPVVVAERDKGIFGSIVRAWDLTRGVGWNCVLLFVIVMLVAFVGLGVINLIVGTICALLAGPQGVPLVETFFSALTGTVFGVTVLALEAALYRHLQRQDG